MRSELRRWQGVVLLAIALVATLWLASTDRLNLYINPDSIVFTVVMAGIGLVLVIAACAAQLMRSHGEHHTHDDREHDEWLSDASDPGLESTPRRRSRAALTTTGAVLAAGLAVGFLVLPPATLTSARAGQRVINSTAVASGRESVNVDAGAASGAIFTKFTVFDWASVLRQTSDVAFYVDKPARVVGFITPDTEDPDNMFYVSRFVITHCAVDAQPVGVPVYSPGWTDGYDADDWVEVSGDFTSNASVSSTQPVVLEPAVIDSVDQPDDPYLY